MSLTMTSSCPARPSFIAELPAKEVTDLKFQLQAFAVRHASHHRPIALVTSGGTAVDLERNSVRCLDNFSTGLRGAISVEEFLKRGYAVIHLCRRGSAAPYARVLSQIIGITQANHGLAQENLGILFQGNNPEENHEDELVKSVLQENDDPWLTERAPGHGESGPAPMQQSKPADDGSIVLHRRVVHNERLARALRERSAAVKEGRLLTVYFRTLEEYLANLELSAEALRDSQSLAVLYLAAAVSDFYIPTNLKSEHKIQSQEAQGDQPGLNLKLHPVPKMMGVLRESWAPDAFVVSFKLETDHTILRQKAERAVSKYGVHMVIGNLLHTRHERVWVLHPPPFEGETAPNPSNWPMKSIARPRSAEVDALEEALMDFVVEQHFDYISRNWNGQGSGAEAAKRTHQILLEKKRAITKEMTWKRVRNIALELAGTFLGAALAYAVSNLIQRPLFGRNEQLPKK